MLPQFARFLFLALIACFMLSPLHTRLFAGDLGDVRESAKGSSSSDDNESNNKKKKKRRRSSHNHYDDCDDDSSFFSDLLGPPILFTVTAPWWGPAAMVGDDYSSVPEFPHYPYQDGVDGYLIFSPEELATYNGIGARFTAEYGNDFSGLERIGGRVQLDTQSRFGIDTEWNHWREEISGGTDELWTGDANLIFRFAQSEKIQFYTGLGLNWMGGGQSDVGFNFTYGFDWFPTDPFVIRSVLDAGTIGDADLYHSKTTIGLVYNYLELYTGYDILHIGDSNLQGLVAGFTLWW
ncbi:hypothetical protein OAF98_02855 [Planctomicrobium sp.]|nr:hypothetical protein [Planctomicrobium sp.]MDA7503538.1 hypothetical protein [bacterium]MDB4743401.1 hypothetical protein [Planctomicrobium sp.]